MSRLTGTDTLGLMEAYQAVYAPKELTEEQVWEEVESWVNSLVEEGYDLSDYTWDDLYEYYVSEANRGDEYATRGMTPFDARLKKQKRRNASLDSGDTHKGAPRLSKGQKEEIRKHNTMAGDEVARQTTLMRQRYTKNKRGLRSEQVELYDIIFSHLLDEGYATTEDGALAIMSNMSEDWIQSIVEATGVIRADVRDPRTRTVAITAGGRVPPGEQLIGNIMNRVGSALRGYNPRAIEVRRPAGPGKGSLSSRNVPKPTGGTGGSSGRASTNYGRGF